MAAALNRRRLFKREDQDPRRSPDRIKAVEGHYRTLVFVAADDTHGLQLWKSDGIAVGTVLLRTLGGSNSPAELTQAGDFVFFAGDDAVSGRELWRTDGTAAGTVRVKDIFPGAASGLGFAIQPFNDQYQRDVLFLSHRRLDRLGAVEE